MSSERGLAIGLGVSRGQGPTFSPAAQGCRVGSVFLLRSVPRPSSRGSLASPRRRHHRALLSFPQNLLLGSAAWPSLLQSDFVSAVLTGLRGASEV